MGMVTTFILGPCGVTEPGERFGSGAPDHANSEPRGIQEFTVEPRGPATQHSLTRGVFDEWLRRSPGSSARCFYTAPGASGGFIIGADSTLLRREIPVWPRTWEG